MADVGVFRLVPEFRRELFVAGMDPMDVALQNREVRSPYNRNWPRQDLKDPRLHAQNAPTHPADYAVARRRRVAFLFVDLCDRCRQFGDTEHEGISQAPRRDAMRCEPRK